MRIVDVLAQERIKVFFDAADKQAVIEELADLVVMPDLSDRRRQVLDALSERERICTTAIGEGVAVPHARVDFCTELLVAFGLARAPIDFGASDGQPVRLFFCVLCPEADTALQLRFLARVSRLMHDTALRDRLAASQSSEEVLQVLREHEARHFG